MVAKGTVSQLRRMSDCGELMSRMVTVVNNTSESSFQVLSPHTEMWYR